MPDKERTTDSGAASARMTTMTTSHGDDEEHFLLICTRARQTLCFEVANCRNDYFYRLLFCKNSNESARQRAGNGCRSRARKEESWKENHEPFSDTLFRVPSIIFLCCWFSSFHRFTWAWHKCRSASWCCTCAQWLPTFLSVKAMPQTICGGFGSVSDMPWSIHGALYSSVGGVNTARKNNRKYKMVWCCMIV